MRNLHLPHSMIPLHHKFLYPLNHLYPIYHLYIPPHSKKTPPTSIYERCSKKVCNSQATLFIPTILSSVSYEELKDILLDTQIIVRDHIMIIFNLLKCPTEELFSRDTLLLHESRVPFHRYKPQADFKMTQGATKIAPPETTQRFHMMMRTIYPVQGYMVMIHILLLLSHI